MATGNRRLSLDQRLWSRLRKDPKTGCWLWQGATTAAGYGIIGYQGKNAYVHRLVWALLIGEIPEGMQLDHGDSQPRHSKACANPAHLEVVTLLENVLRYQEARAAQTIFKSSPKQLATWRAYRERKRLADSQLSLG